MIIIGLTGSIGMGKSTAAKMLKKMGCPVHDSDAAVRHALSPKGAGFEEVAVTFPEAWDKKKHVIKKDVLAALIFKDPAARKKLENILHPIAQRSQQVFIRKQRQLGRKVAVLDIPLLFETGAESRVDYTFVVTAPHHIQRRRVLARPNMTPEKFAAILATQMPDREKCLRADFVIPTGLGLAYTHAQLKSALEQIL